MRASSLRPLFLTGRMNIQFQRWTFHLGDQASFQPITEVKIQPSKVRIADSAGRLQCYNESAGILSHKIYETG